MADRPTVEAITLSIVGTEEDGYRWHVHAVEGEFVLDMTSEPDDFPFPAAARRALLDWLRPMVDGTVGVAITGPGGSSVVRLPVLMV